MKPSGRISSIAKIFASANTAAIECILVDYSAGGACLQLKAFMTLPDRFDVLYGTTRKHCRVVWKRGLRLGVTFLMRMISARANALRLSEGKRLHLCRSFKRKTRLRRGR